MASASASGGAFRQPSVVNTPEAAADLMSQLLELTRLPAIVTELRRELEALRTQVELAKGSASEPLVDIDGAANLLGMTPAALRQAVYRGTVRPVRIGRRLRFRRDDLLGHVVD
jgi:hypothetical protein